MRQSTQVRVCSHHDLHSGSVSSLTHNMKFLEAGKHSCVGMFDSYKSCLLMSTAFIFLTRKAPQSKMVPRVVRAGRGER